MILILLGKRGVGKTTLAKLFESKNGFKHYEMSTYLKEVRSEMNMEYMKLRKFVDFLHKAYSKDFALKNMAKKGLLNKYQNIVITGVRNPKELIFLKDNFDVYPIYLKLPFRKRYLRVKKRNGRSSFIDFLIEEYYSIKWNDITLQKLAFSFNNSSRITKSYSNLRDQISSLE